MRLSRDNHPDREGGSAERFGWLTRSFEAAEDGDDAARQAA
jgi:hypothetical protein